MKRIALATAAVLLLLGPELARAQDVGGNLESLARDNAELYARPVFEGMGNALTAGFVRTPDVHDQLGFDIGVRIMGALIPDEKKSFTPVLPSSITVDGSEFPDGMDRTFSNPYSVQGGPTSPTAVGDGDGVTLAPAGAFADSLAKYGKNPADFEVPFPEGFDVPAIPFAVIQAGLGVGFGTEVSARFIPGIEVDDEVGEVSAFGLGVTHQINRWLPGPVPVDLAAFGGYQSFTVGEYLDASTTTLGVAVGKGLGPLSVYGMGQYESPSVDLEYTVSNPNDNPALPDDGEVIRFSPGLEGGTRFGVGAQLDLLLLQFALEYSAGDYNAVTGRISLSFR